MGPEYSASMVPELHSCEGISGSVGDGELALYSCLRAKNGHLFWNSDNQSVKSIVFELFERMCGKVPVAGKGHIPVPK